MSTIKQIEDWFIAAVPNPTQDNLRVQIGCHLEEMGEMLEALDEEGYDAHRWVKELATCYKTGDFEPTVENEEALLDSLCDQIVTAIGVAHMKGYDIEGALKEVARSNASKFVDGKPIFNENGKIQKGPNYSKPNLKPYLFRGY